ncbi:MAG: hypothetical protein ACREJ6_00005, partial [Candidatus Methylomirabilis sp.]
MTYASMLGGAVGRFVLKRLLTALAFLLPVSVWAGDTRYVPNEDGTALGYGMLGSVSSAIATDETMNVLHHLDHLQNVLPLTDYWFSAEGAGGEFPAGDDSNPCTRELPCESPERAITLSRGGYVHIIWDAGDTWNTDSEFAIGAGPIASLTYQLGTGEGSCSNSGRTCVLWSGSDFTGRTTPLFDLTALTPEIATGLFEPNQSTDDYWAFQNIHIKGPKSDTAPQDIFRPTTGSGRLITLNVFCEALRGPLNQCYTSHSTTAYMVLINPHCTEIDHAAGAS